MGMYKMELLINDIIMVILEILLKCNHLYRHNITTGAASGGHIKILEWAITKGFKLDVNECAYAASYGKLETLKWLRQNNCPWNTSTCENAALNGHLKILKW